MQIDISQVKWDDTPASAQEKEGIDISQVKWDENVPSPIQSQSQPKKEKEYGTLEKIYDFVTNNPVANYLPNKIAEWSGIDEEKKVDRETLYNIESLAKIDTRLVGDASPEQKEQYLLNVAKVLEKKGYKLAEIAEGDNKEYVAIDADGNQKEITNNFFNSIVDGLLADKYEIGGAIAGAAKGYNLTKAVPNPWVKAASVLTGGAIGAMAGTAADTAAATYATDQEFKIEDFFNELNKSAALDITGAIAGAGLVKVGSKLVELPKGAWDYVAADNIDGAKNILKKITNYTDDEIDAALEAAKQQYKEVDKYTKSGLTSQAKKQEALLAAAQSDKKIGSSYIHDAVLDDVDAAEAVSKTIDARTKNLVGSFENVAIDGTGVKKAVEGYEKQVAANYGKMRDTFKEAFSNVDYAFDLKALKTDEIMSNVVDDIVNPYDKDVAKNLLTKVEKIVGDDGGMTRNFDNLIELRQVVNDFYSRAQKSLSHDSKEVFAQLKKNIDTELYSAIDKNIPKEMQKPLKDLFEGAIQEYRDMYAVKDTKLYKTLMDEGMSAEKRMDALIKHTADDEMEFATLLTKLPAPEQIKIENSITKAVLEKNLLGATNELQVIDYNKAVATLGKLEDFMVTPSGKESVKIIKDMALKFGDDIELMRAANQAGVSTNAGIATSVVGRLEYKLAKNAFDRLARLVPFSDTSKRLALQKHLTEALKKSRTPIDMAKRVAASEDISKSDKADLLEWARDFNRINSLKNEQQAQKLLMEVEAKEAAKAKAEAEAKAMLESFDSVDNAELLAVQKLGGYDALAQTVKNLQNPSARTVDDVKKFVAAKAKIDPKRLEEQIVKIKYPLKDAGAKIEKLLSTNSDDLALLTDEQTFKVLQYDIKQGALRNDKIKDAYKQTMKLYDLKNSQKTPQELLKIKEVELKTALRKAAFEESVDDLAAAAKHRATAQTLQNEIKELQGAITPTADMPKPLSSQAQRAKEIADMNYHDSEDEATQAVKNLFKTDNSEEKYLKNMTVEDMAEWERMHATEKTQTQKPSHLSDDDWNEANAIFASSHIGSGLVAGSANALEYDEEGNIVGFDEAGFVSGFLLGTIGSKVGASALKKHNPKLYNKISGVSKEFPNMATSNPKLLSEIYKAAPNTKGQALMFAGEKAIKANIGKLDDAMKLLDNGASEADVWKKTGWFKGDDGKWRFEVDDSGATVLTKAELDELAKNDPYEMVELPLSQILRHDDLFKNYPQLNDIKVNWEYSKAKGLEDEKNIYYGANYDPKEKLITIGNGLDDREIKSALLHEIQHAIQTEENFARGGSSTSKEVVQKAFENLYERYGSLPYVEKLEFDYLGGKLGEKEFKNKILNIANSTEEAGIRGYLHDIYKLLHGEAEARLTQTRADKGYENFPYDDLDVPRDELIKKFDGGEAQMSQVTKEYKGAQGFYSVLEKTIDEKVGGKIDANALKNMLEKNGVKQDEIEWSGLKELMESKEKLTREEIEETIKSNRLEIEVVEKKTENPALDEIRERFINGENNIELPDELPGEVKYKEYKLNGGENYRELLFKTPDTQKPYKSNHWDEGNILVFTRVDDRKIDGKNTLFIEELQSDWHQEGRKQGYGKAIPNAPFKKNWHELGLKRMLQEAVANDYEKIAWTTGKQQADRYSLEKTVDTVVYNKDAGVIQATNGSKEVFFKHVANEKEIEEMMGKELTARLLDKKNTTNDSVHVLQGEELKFGGEGMQAFYDEILPNSVKKLFKKWGTKPKMEELDDVEQMVWSVDITPQMKEDVKKYGQPLYAVGGAVIANEAIEGDEK